MGKGTIIFAFATCGKSYLGKKYSNVIDLESIEYKHDNSDLKDIPVEKRKGTFRKLNSKWPNNYYKAIIEAQEKYDVVLVQLKPEHFDYFDKANIEYSIAYPDLNNFEKVKERCLIRGNNDYFIKRLEEVFKPYYDDSIKRKYKKMYILKDDMTLEDCLLQDNINLELKIK